MARTADEERIKSKKDESWTGDVNTPYYIYQGQIWLVRESYDNNSSESESVA
jgi:hypothetical protein